MEIQRKKNEATVIFFPMVTIANPELFVAGLTVSDDAYYSDGSTPAALAIADTVTEIGSTGMYWLAMAQAEMNHDFIIIKFTDSASNDTGAEQMLIIRTKVGPEAKALEDVHLDHLLAVDYNPASKPGVATALLNELVESDGGVARYTANALEQAPTGGGGGGFSMDDSAEEAVSADYTWGDVFRIMAAALAGPSSGGGTSTHTFRDLGDTKDRIIATADANGNRTAVTHDGT